MKNPTNLEVASYGGSIITICAGLTLEQWGILAGIATAALTFVLNVVYTIRKDRREQRESEARIEQLHGGGQ